MMVFSSLVRIWGVWVHGVTFQAHTKMGRVRWAGGKTKKRRRKLAGLYSAGVVKEGKGLFFGSFGFSWVEVGVLVYC